MALAIDGSTPALLTSNPSNVSSLTTASFTPPAGALLVVMYTNGNNTGVLQTTPTNTGGTVSWNGSAAVSLSSNGAAASIWLGTVTTSASMTVTVHTVGGSAQSFWSAGVAVVTGQAASPTGQTQTATSTSGLPSATISSLTGANSLVLAAVADNTNSSTTPVVGSNQTLTFNGNSFNDSTASFSGWRQYDTRINLAAGSSDTLNVTTPTINYTMAMLEILAASSAVAGPYYFFKTQRHGPLRGGPFALPVQQHYGSPAGSSQFSQVFTAGLSFAGSLTKSTAKNLTAGLSFTGSLLKAIVKTAFVAVLSFSGALFNSTTKLLAGVLSFAGSLARATVKLLAAVLSFTGKLLKAILHGLTAGLSFTGNLLKGTVKTAFTAVLSFTGGFVKGLAHILTFTATLSFAGSLQRATTKALAGVLSFAGAIKRATSKALAGVLSFGGSLFKATVKTPLTAALGFTGSMLKGVGKKLAGGLSFVGGFTTTKAHPSAIPDICPPTTLVLAIPSSTLDVEGPVTTGLDVEIANSTAALNIPTSTAALTIPNSTSTLAIPNSTANLAIPSSTLDVEIPNTTLDLESC